MVRTVVLIGFMGCGKTTFGEEAARRLQMDFIDMDREIERRQGRTIAQIFAEDGEAAFRQMETDLLTECCKAGGTIVATGGGVVKNPENIRRIRESGALTVYLKTPPEELYRRLADDRTRPLLADTAGEARYRRICDMLEARRPLYEAAAGAVYEEAGRTVSGILTDFPAWIAKKIEKV